MFPVADKLRAQLARTGNSRERASARDYVATTKQRQKTEKDTQTHKTHTLTNSARFHHSPAADRGDYRNHFLSRVTGGANQQVDVGQSRIGLNWFSVRRRTNTAGQFSMGLQDQAAAPTETHGSCPPFLSGDLGTCSSVYILSFIIHVLKVFLRFSVQ